MKTADYYFYEVMGFKPYERSAAALEEFRNGITKEEQLNKFDEILKQHDLIHLKDDYVMYNKLVAEYMPIFNVTPYDEASHIWASAKRNGLFQWKQKGEK